MGWRRLHIYRRVIVTTRDGRSFDGVLQGRPGPLIVLRDAALLADGQRHRIDGEVIMERDHIDFVQVPPEVRR